MNPAPAAPLLVAIALLSTAVLAYEVLLMRLLSIVQWHHFAHMIISLSLLGYGASGALLAGVGDRLLARFEVAFPVLATLFGIAGIAGFAAAQALPFNPLELLWDPRQGLWLAAVYLLLMLPFLLAASAIGLAFMRHRVAIGRLYGVDLLGAGAGALVVVLALQGLHPTEALAGVGVLAGAAGLAAALPRLRARPWPALLAGAALCLSGAFVLSPITLTPSPFKGLSQALQAVGAEVLAERSSALGLVTAVGNTRVPFREAPGLSLTSPEGPPEQVALFTDADAMSVVTRLEGEAADLGFLAQMTSAAPYALLRAPRVLVLGAGGGLDVLQALHHGASRVDAVELNPVVVDLVRTRFADYAGDLYRRPEVHLHLAEARAYMRGSAERYDLVQLALLDSFAASSAGLYALSEGYLYTVEALMDALGRLEPGGLLAITRWVKVPPRDGLKLFATAIAALKRLGVDRPQARLAWVQGWSTGTLLVKNGELTDAEVSALEAFCATRGFEPAYLAGRERQASPGRGGGAASLTARGAAALAGEDAAQFVERYRFDIRPATDDRPFFFNFFRWEALPEILARRAQGALGLLDAGYLVLWLTFSQTLAASLALVALPAWLGHRRRRSGSSPGRQGAVVFYFSAIGLGFILLEVAFIQRLVLFLGHPVYAAAAVLGGLLLFAGLGSLLAGRLRPWATARWGPAAPVVLGTGAVVLVSLAELAVLPGVLTHCLHWPLPARAVTALLAVAPLAFVLGLPFPLGLSSVAEHAPALIPLAWAANGCTSVVGAVLAALLSMQLGFQMVFVVALGLYLLASWAGGWHLRPAAA
jgi:hypothetical protein